jgi:hypothetical protein
MNSLDKLFEQAAATRNLVSLHVAQGATGTVFNGTVENYDDEFVVVQGGSRPDVVNRKYITSAHLLS